MCSETRDYGFGGPLRIKPSDIKAVLDMRGIWREEDLDLVLRMIPQLDVIWLDDHYKRQEQNKKGKGKG